MMNNTPQKPIQPVRGAIYYCNLGENPGSVQDGYRPVLVISSNDICRTSPVVTIAPITSVLKRTDLPGHVLLPTDCEALTKPSMLLLEQLKTIPVSDLGEYRGMLRGNDTWIQINDGIKKVLGLWHKHREPRKYSDPYQSVTCLCSRCLDYYRNSPSYRIKRLTPEKGARDICDRCGYNFGVDYLITELRRA